MQLPGDIAYNLMQQSATPFHKHSLKHFKVRFNAEHKKQTQIWKKDTTLPAIFIISIPINPRPSYNFLQLHLLIIEKTWLLVDACIGR